jgi:glutamate synthase (NADPH/NADH) small chain
MWSILTKRFIGENGHVKQAEIADVEWVRGDSGRMEMREIPGTLRTINADLVLLSMGFVHAVHEGLLNDLGLAYDQRGNVSADHNHKTAHAKVFTAGDAMSGASLVVTSIASGRKAAAAIMEYLG